MSREITQRELKFRALVPVNSDGPKTMQYFDLSKIDDCNRLSYVDYDFRELMQYTGHKDRNDVEIYNDDILKFFDKIVAIVVWKDFGGWSFNWIDPTYKAIRQMSPEPFFHNINLFEVVGNIHQHPHLLK